MNVWVPYEMHVWVEVDTEQGEVCDVIEWSDSLEPSRGHCYIAHTADFAPGQETTKAREIATNSTNLRRWIINKEIGV